MDVGLEKRGKMAKPEQVPLNNIEYKRLSGDRVLVIARRSGDKPLKTIVEVFSPHEIEELEESPAPANQ